MDTNFYPRVGKIFSLNLIQSKKTNIDNFVNMFNAEDYDFKEYVGEEYYYLNNNITLSFKIIEIFVQYDSINEVRYDLEKYYLMPSSQWLFPFMEKYDNDADCPIGIIDPFWMDCYNREYIPIIDEDGMPTFCNISLLYGNYRWLVIIG